MALRGCAQVMKIGTLWTEEAGRRGVIVAKSQEGLYMNPQDSTFMADQWETMGSELEVKVGPESSATVYANDALVGVSTDCRALTKRRRVELQLWMISNHVLTREETCIPWTFSLGTAHE